TPEGVTSLMIALDNAHYETADHLLDAGANPHISDWWGRSALYIAIDMSSRGGGGDGGRGGGPAGLIGPGGVIGPGGPGGPDGPGGAPAGVQFAEAVAPRVQFTALQLAARLLEMGVNPNTQLNMHRPGRG